MVKLVQSPEGAPNFCFGLYDTVTDECKVFIQVDWDYAGLARNLGWPMSRLQRCQWCGSVYRTDVPGDDEGCDETDGGSHGRTDRCDHEGTDGTVDCRGCGLQVGDMLADAFDFLEEHDGETFDLSDYE